MLLRSCIYINKETERCISVTQQPLTSQDPTQATTLETPSLMAPISRVLFLVVIVVVAMAVLPPSPVHGEDDSMYCKYTYIYHPIVFLADILDIYMTNH
jgi:hypothetical protein